VAECVAHLNLTSRAYLPLLRDGITEGRRLARQGPARRYRRDFMGWLMWRSAGPPVRIRTSTTAPFLPQAEIQTAELLADFARLQDAQLTLLGEADGLPLERVQIVSPFDRRIRYNLYACFTILPRHQHRHLWQAERVLERLARSA
jgi:hypothetical protein